MRIPGGARERITQTGTGGLGRGGDLGRGRGRGPGWAEGEGKGPGWREGTWRGMGGGGGGGRLAASTISSLHSLPPRT